MRRKNRLAWTLMLASALLSCGEDKADREPVTLEAGAPMAGVSSGLIDFPMGTPLGGYSSRCNIMGSAGKVD